MKRIFEKHGVKILISTVDIGGRFEAMAVALNEDDERSDELACVRGASPDGAERECLYIVKRMTKKQLLEKLKVHFNYYGNPNHNFAKVRQELALSMMCEDGDMSIIEVTSC